MGSCRGDNTSSENHKLLTTTPATTQRGVLEWELGGGSLKVWRRVGWGCWKPSRTRFSANLRTMQKILLRKTGIFLEHPSLASFWH